MYMQTCGFAWVHVCLYVMGYMCAHEGMWVFAHAPISLCCCVCVCACTHAESGWRVRKKQGLLDSQLY